MTDRGYRGLIAWQKAMALARSVYLTSEAWPRSEQFGLVVQVRRAVTSVPANIAEGAGRTGKSEFAHHLSIAHGSLCEVETFIELAMNFGYLSDTSAKELLEQANEVGRLIRGLIGSLKSTRG